MKHTYLFRGILAVLFLASFWLGRDGAKDNQEVHALSAQVAKTPAPQQTKETPEQEPAAAKQKSMESLRKILNTESTGALYTALFDEKILSVMQENAVAEIRRRFARQYPKEEKAYQREVVKRMGIMKAMAATFPPGKDTESAYRLYRELLPRESWLVRRQLVRNLAPWLSAKSEQERLEVRKVVGSRVIASAELSDEEILEQVFREAY